MIDDLGWVLSFWNIWLSEVPKCHFSLRPARFSYLSEDTLLSTEVLHDFKFLLLVIPERLVNNLCNSLVLHLIAFLVSDRTVWGTHVIVARIHARRSLQLTLTGNFYSNFSHTTFGFDTSIHIFSSKSLHLNLIITLYPIINHIFKRQVSLKRLSYLSLFLTLRSMRALVFLKGKLFDNIFLARVIFWWWQKIFQLHVFLLTTRQLRLFFFSLVCLLFRILLV